MSNIEIVFLTFNRLELNKISLPALLDSDPDIDYKVCIYDNGSTDGTVEWLKTLDHPKIKEINFNSTNEGIAPITNRFWKKTKATYIGKVDNDLIVPSGWIKEVMLRLENAEEEKMGSVTLYHWIDEWTKDLDEDKMPIITLKNGSKMVLSSHTGGNYLFHRYLIDLLGYVPENRGLKGGYTWWQLQKFGTIKCGYVYPLKFFRLPELYKSWERFSGKPETWDTCPQWLKKEMVEAKRLLEIPLSVYNNRKR